MTAVTAASTDAGTSTTPLPPLSRDLSFHGMLATQFLGAFNDNLFKQMVLLICLDYVAQGGARRDSMAAGIFALSFVAFSGFAGWLSDRYAKRTIIVLMKVAEIVIMLAGLAAFLQPTADPGRQLAVLFPVLFLMGAQSAFFGPPKYGILPEMLRERDLPAANGMIQMTTFLAIIFGTALAGFAKDWLQSELWIVNAACVGIAVVGWLTSLLVRRTPIARPGLPFHASALLIDGETWRLLRRDRELRAVLLISSLFWFIAGGVQLAVNSYGRFVLGLNDGRTSLGSACMGIGIAVGCAIAARASHKSIHFGLVHLGAWGIVGSLAALTVLGWRAVQLPLPERLGAESLPQLMVPRAPFELASRTVLTLLGMFAGLFVVPLQVFLQARPPEEQKGRMIGAMNLVNWIAILFSAGFVFGSTAALAALGIGRAPAESAADAGRNAHWLFGLLSLVMLPVAMMFRPPTVVLSNGNGEGGQPR